MTPNQLYASMPESSTHQVYNILESLESRLGDVQIIHDKIVAGRNILVKTHKYINLDGGDRHWALYSVWFYGKPLMIVQSAGRSGKDHYREIITDGLRLNGMIDYIRSLDNERFSCSP